MSTKNRIEQLRQRATEALLRSASSVDAVPDVARRGVTSVIEELRIYQAELELQNQELAQAQAMAETERAHYLALFESLPVPAIVTEPSGVTMQANAAARALFGMTQAQFHRHSIFRLLAQPDQPGLAALLAQDGPLAPGRARPVRLRTVEDDDHEFMVRAVALPGSFHIDPHRVLLLEDQSAQRAVSDQAEAMRRSEARFRLAQEATGVGIWESDLRADEITCDSGAWRLLGLPGLARPLSRAQALDLLCVDAQEATLAEVKRQIRAHGHFELDLPVRQATGGERWLQARGQVITRDHHQLPAYLIGTLIDVQAQRQAQSRALALQTQMGKLTDNVPGVLYQHQRWPGGRGALPFVSAGLRQMLGLDPEALRNSDAALFDAVRPEDRAMVSESLWNSARHLSVWNVEFRMQHVDGRCLWVNALSSPERRPDGSTLWHGYLHDITARRELELRALEESRRLANILWGTGAGTWEWNVCTGEVRFNERWAEMVGHTLQSLQPLSIAVWEQLVHPDDMPLVRRELALHFEGASEDYHCEFRMQHRRGHWVWVLDRGRVFTRTADGQPEWMMGTHTDISDRKAAEERLQHLAHFDVLTGLPGRVLLDERLAQAMARARRQGRHLALAFVDLDRFKEINDTWGHATGDAVLRVTAQRLRGSLREVDTVARIGGDEFVLLISDLDDAALSLPMVERTLSAVTERIEYGGQTLQIGASIGLAVYPQARELDAAALLSQADRAMYEAKAGGRNSLQQWKDSLFA